MTEEDFRFTASGGRLYAFYKYPSTPARIHSLASDLAKVERVTLLGTKPVTFSQTAEALVCELPPVSEDRRLIACGSKARALWRLPEAANISKMSCPNNFPGQT